MNYYETLKVPETASQDEIKSAYRKLAKEYHPDLSNVDPEIMIEINNQYEIYLNKIKNPIQENQKEIVKEVKVKKEKFKIIFNRHFTILQIIFIYIYIQNIISYEQI